MCSSCGGVRADHTMAAEGVRGRVRGGGRAGAYDGHEEVKAGSYGGGGGGGGGGGEGSASEVNLSVGGRREDIIRAEGVRVEG